MEDALTWKSLKALIAEGPRGTKHRLAKRLGLDASDLTRRLDRDGELTQTQARIVREFLSGAEIEAAIAEASPARLLPVYGFAAGGDVDRIDLREGRLLDRLALPHGLVLGPGDYFGVRQPSSTMEPRIFSGETLVVCRDYPPAKDKDVLVEFRDGTGVLKTYDAQRQGRVFVRQWNDARTIDFDASTVKALHAVAFKL